MSEKNTMTEAQKLIYLRMIELVEHFRSQGNCFYPDNPTPEDIERMKAQWASQKKNKKVC